MNSAHCTIYGSCPVAEWLERRAECDMCASRGAGSKPDPV